MAIACGSTRRQHDRASLETKKQAGESDCSLYDSVQDQSYTSGRREKHGRGRVDQLVVRLATPASSGNFDLKMTDQSSRGSGNGRPASPRCPRHLTGYKKYKPLWPGRPTQSRSTAVRRPVMGSRGNQKGTAHMSAWQP